MSRSFDGSDDYIAWSSIANLTGHALTISAWVWLDDWTPTNQYIFGIQDSGDISYGLVFNLLDAGDAMSFVVNGSTDSTPYANCSFPTGAWRHVLVTWNGLITYDENNAHFYLNGVEQTKTGWASGASETTHTGKWVIGGRTYSADRTFDGLIAEVAVWDAIVSGATITGLASGKPPDDYPTNLQFYYSSISDTTVAEVGGTGTANGSTYSTSHPNIELTIADATCAVTSDAPALTVNADLTVAAATCAVTADNVVIVYNESAVNISLTVQNATCAVTSEAPALTVHSLLVVADATCAVSAGVLTSGSAYHGLLALTSSVGVGEFILTVHAYMTVAAATCAVTVDNVVVVPSRIALTVADATCAVTADNVTIQASRIMLAAAAATCSVTSEAPALTAHAALAVGDGICAVISDAPGLTEHAVLTVANAACAVIADNLEIVYHETTDISLTVQNATCAVTSEEPGLTVNADMTVADATCAVTGENVVINYVVHTALVVDDATSLSAVDAPGLTGHNYLAVADADAVAACEEPGLTGHGYLSVADATCLAAAETMALLIRAYLIVAAATCDVNAEGVTIRLSKPTPDKRKHSVPADDRTFVVPRRSG